MGGRVDCGHCNGSGQVESAEEWAIHDYDGFAHMGLGENESFAKVAAIAEKLEEHGAAFAAWYNWSDACYDDSPDLSFLESFTDEYQGEWDDEEAFGAHLYEDCYGDPDEMEDPNGYGHKKVRHPLAGYMSHAVDAWAKDLFRGGDYSSVEAHPYDDNAYGIYVFRKD